jgi:hypothetical protein
MMKLLTEYIERALHFERLAAEETNSKFKDELHRQAEAYRKLAAEQAKKLGLLAPGPPETST